MRVIAVVCLLLAGCTTAPSASTTTLDELPGREQLLATLNSLPGAGAPLAVGERYRYEFFIHCGMRYLRPSVDDRDWETVAPPYETGRWPDSWRAAFSNPRESISPSLMGTLELISEDTLVFRVPGFDIEAVYSATTAEIPGCA